VLMIIEEGGAALWMRVKFERFILSNCYIFVIPFELIRQKSSRHPLRKCSDC
jgi:hypothetical protein